jgi:Arc/MetJ-type ribon-helix-helix transcriptional regulator
MVANSKNDGIIASRVPKDLIVGLDELVRKGAFENRSRAVLQAIVNLLRQTEASENRIAEPTVNRANEGDDISRSLEELFSLQRK